MPRHLTRPVNLATMTPGAKFVAYLALVLAGLIGAASMLAFMVFLYAGPLGVVDLGLSATVLLAWDTLFCIAFFLQHSGMIRRSFRRGLARIIPPHYHGAVYTVVSGTVLLSLVLFWQESADTLINLQGPLRWIVRAAFFVSIAGLVWGVRAFGSFDAFGLDPILNHLRGTHTSPLPLTVRGPYRWVRHPLYSFMILLIWSSPHITVDRLLFNALWTGWVVVGTVLEERDLVADFGDAYRDYQRRVPMLVPWWIRADR